MRENIFKTYADHKHLYLMEMPQGSILFRLLPYENTRIAERICKTFPSLTPKIEDDIWDECVIEHSFPSGLEHMNAGIIASVVRVIIKLSAPKTIEEMQGDLDKEREKLRDVRDQIIVKICEAFPGYTPDEVTRMDWPTLVERLSQAEKILGTEFVINPSDAAKVSATNIGVATKLADDGQQYIDFAKENRTLRDT
jgi:hypothetical protein